jgi:hypothetical protein
LPRSSGVSAIVPFEAASSNAQAIAIRNMTPPDSNSKKAVSHDKATPQSRPPRQASGHARNLSGDHGREILDHIGVELLRRRSLALGPPVGSIQENSGGEGKSRPN